MVTCRLVGGMANQMFIIAATIGYAAKHGMPFHIPDQSSHPDHWKTYFHNVPGSATPDPLAPWQPFIYYDQKFSFSEIPYHPQITLVPSDITTGYFQSEKYFAHCRQQVRQAFGFKYEKREGWVSIHVRRGDYLNENNKDFYRTPTAEYLEKSINFFYEKGCRTFLVVSDDLPWSHEVLNKLKFSAVLSFNFPCGQPLVDMQAASCCEHNIGSASSFSWWIAWLNQNPDKICMFPKPWFGPAGPKDTQDLLPEGWLQME